MRNIRSRPGLWDNRKKAILGRGSLRIRVDPRKIRAASQVKGTAMNREVCKFLSGSFGALAYVHAAYAVATSRGIINEPVFLGRRWGVGYMWTEAAVYSALSVALGYAGWSSKPQAHHQQTVSSAAAGQNSQPVPAAAQS